MVVTEGFEVLNNRIWGSKIALATTNHALGGIGVGLLLGGARERRPMAYTLVGFALAAHVYAWLTRDRAESTARTSRS